ncbi:MAG: hypothetical protein EOM06_12705 [Sphingobacteriia bacterium]|nr:hypothetical protein [Sphingobacteriia bacterium]
MGKPKGAPKSGGRVAGTPNRTTAEMRQLFQTFVETNMEKLQSDFEALTPSERINILMKMIPVFLPPPLPEQPPDPWGLDQLPTKKLIEMLDAYSE